LAGSCMGTQEQENQHDSPASRSPGGSETSHGLSLSFLVFTEHERGIWSSIFSRPVSRSRHKYLFYF
jgi:hypothetical protein